MRPERTATAWISSASCVPTSDFFFPSIIRSICLCREIKQCAVWQTSDKFLETDGFCVRDTAQSFLLAKGTQVLYSTSNKRGTLCDPDNTFHTNASSGRFSFLNQHTCQSKKNTTFHSRTLVFARSPIPTPFTCCPMPPRSGLMNLFATFSK